MAKPKSLKDVMGSDGVGALAESARATEGAPHEDVFRRHFEAAKDGILIIDGRRRCITEVNRHFEVMLGHARAELVGREPWDIGPFRDIAASRQAMQELIGQEYIRYDDLSLLTRSGKRLQAEVIANAYLVDGERVIQCNVRDITARRLAESAQVKTTDELRELVAEMQQHDLEMRHLHQLNDLLQACATQEEAHRVIAMVAGDLFAGHSGFLAILDPKTQRLQVVARWGQEPVAIADFALADCLAMRRGLPLDAGKPGDDAVCAHRDGQGAARFVCVPLTAHGEALGLLAVFGAAGDEATAPRRAAIAVKMGETIRLALSNLRLRETLREQATLDALTGLFNRRYLDDTLVREVHRAHRRQSPLCLAMLDIDHFKVFNDTYGHDAGDALLRDVGEVLRSRLRKSDISCRYGGEEFVLVLPDSAMADTRRRVEQIAAVVKAIDFRHGTLPAGRITVSAGIAQTDAEGSSAADLLRAADTALYAAKRAGRDCVREAPLRESGAPADTLLGC